MRHRPRPPRPDPLSALIGAIILLTADVGARTLITNADLSPPHGRRPNHAGPE
ncbi:hypothetical protein [Nocardia sp. N2S4-5]|uniref:hypothetical protein n=1 Tax=Nocardia sp. N2S4-5 TaxID=3351565 RepID=UPI0037D1574C